MKVKNDYLNLELINVFGNYNYIPYFYINAYKMSPVTDQ